MLETVLSEMRVDISVDFYIRPIDKHNQEYLSSWRGKHANEVKICAARSSVKSFVSVNENAIFIFCWLRTWK